MNRDRVQQIIRDLLLELGEDPTREGLRETPARTAALIERFAVKRPQPLSLRTIETPPSRGQAMTLHTFTFVSLCEHHLLPFFGKVHIGCMARDHECDSAYVEHVVATYAHQPQLQERMTEQIADELMSTLAAEGVGVAAEGRHMCMMMRGVQKQSSEIQSSTLRGCFYQATIRHAFFMRAAMPAPP